MRKFTDVERVHLRYVLGRVMARTVEEGFNVPIVDWAIQELAKRFECSVPEGDYAHVLEKKHLEAMGCLLDVIYSGTNPGPPCGNGMDCSGIKEELLQKGLLTYQYSSRPGKIKWRHRHELTRPRLVVSDVGWDWVGRFDFKILLIVLSKRSRCFIKRVIAARPVELLAELLVSDNDYLRATIIQRIDDEEDK